MPEDSYSVLSAEERDQQVETAKMLLAMLEEKDPRLRQHCERVANTSANFCEATGLMADDELHHLYLAGLLHDVGLIGTPPR